jgi:ribosomal protein L34E
MGSFFHSSSFMGRQVLPPASVLLLSNSTQKSPQRKYGGILSKALLTINMVEYYLKPFSQ